LPMPLAAPVTMQTLSLSFMMSVLPSEVGVGSDQAR